MGDREKGASMYNEVYCGDLPEPPAAGDDRWFDFMLSSLFSELWGNDTLSIEQRRLLLLGAIAAQGEENTFLIQCRAALKRGELSYQQLEEVTLFMTQYVGYPKGSKLRGALATLASEYQ